MKLNEKQVKALEDVREGSYIYALDLAMTLRELQKNGLVSITSAQGAQEDVAKRQPYFGCILNAKGGKALEENNPESQRLTETVERTEIAAKAIREHRRGYDPYCMSGDMPCPFCDGGTLIYQVSTYNDHIGAECTEGCVNFQE